MVYRKRRITRKPRRNVKRRYAKAKIYKRPRSAGIPPFMFAKLKYDSNRQATLLANALDSRLWSLNSLFDPDITATGNQPYYFDQYSALYNHYRVFGCKVEVKFSCATANAVSFHPIVCMCPYTGSNNWGTNIQNMMSSGLSVWKVAIPNVNTYTLKKYFTINSICGVPKSAVSTNPYFEAAINSSPAINVNLALWTQNMDGTASYSFGFEVQLTYYAKFYDRQMPSPS